MALSETAEQLEKADPSLARYNRQMLWQPIGIAGQKKLRDSKVLLVGCGALGTVLANTLARAGVGHLTIVDRGSGGKTVVRQGQFEELPFTPFATTNNPYRGLIGYMQKKDILEKDDTRFSQFYLAMELIEHKVVDWDDIDRHASDKDMEKAAKKAAKWFESHPKAGHSRPRVESWGGTCEGLLGK